MKKIMILTLFPAPYRVDVFKGLQEKHQVDVFFEKRNVSGRDEKWYENLSKLNYFTLDNDEGIIIYNEAIKNLQKYDLVILYEYSTKQACKLMLKCINQKVKYAINCDGAFINNNFFKKVIKSYFIKRAAACFAGSKSAIDYFQYYGVKEDSIYEHNFSSIKQDEIIKKPISFAQKTIMKAELNISYKKIVLSIGQFIYRKGYDLLLKAISINNTDKDIGYYIIGGEVPDEYLMLKEKYSLDNVHFLPFMKKEELKKYYQISDVFVLPTREDVWGLVINEAMANGLPVITTNRCIAGTEMIDEGKNGYIYEINDIKKLNNLLDICLNKTEKEAFEMGNNSIKKAGEYTIEDIIKSHSYAIKNCIGE